MTTGTGTAPKLAPLSLAELHALATLNSPGNGAIGALAAMVPLYAIRSAQTIESVWAMPARDAVDGIMTAVANAFTESSLLSMRDDLRYIARAIDPSAMAARMKVAA